jgi:hypothetical protein
MRFEGTIPNFFFKPVEGKFLEKVVCEPRAVWGIVPDVQQSHRWNFLKSKDKVKGMLILKVVQIGQENV